MSRMRDLSNDEVLELEWYFGGGAEADLGARSIQSGFEAQMHRLAMAGPRQDGYEVWTDGEVSWVEGQIPARESRATAARFDLPADREEEVVAAQLVGQVEDRMRNPNAMKDARRIYNRLQLLSRREHATLELHFGDAVRIKGVSLNLLCMTKPVLDATAKVNARRRRREEKAGRESPDPIGPRDAVQRLLTTESDAERAILDVLVAEAAGTLRAALEAYAHARLEG